jgi:hypothetical protein
MAWNEELAGIEIGMEATTGEQNNARSRDIRNLTSRPSNKRARPSTSFRAG